MDKLKAMQTFVRIADEGSLTAAAQAGNASLPAVVRSLAALEAALGVRLFHRTTRRISLTEEGKRYLESCRLLLASVEDAEAALTASARAPAGRLTLTAPVLFGQMYVAPAVTRFVQRFDGVRCTLLLYNRVVNLLEEGIDAGVRIGALEDSSLVAQPLGSLRRMVVASPAWLRRHGTPQHPRELRTADCIRSGGARGGWKFHENGKSFQVAVAGRLEFNDVRAAIDACVAGMGVGMFISYQVAPLLREKRLRLVLGDFEPPAQPLNVVYPHARLLPARTRAFIEFIKAEFKDLPAAITSL